VFETANALDKLEGFCSHFGAQFYQLPVNQATITLQQQSWRVPSHYEWGNSRVVPLYANQTLNWQIINEKNYL
jgi:dihydroorotase